MRIRESSSNCVRLLRQSEQWGKESIDQNCKQAIAETAVDARRWLSTNATHPMIKSYTDFAGRFYKARRCPCLVR